MFLLLLLLLLLSSQDLATGPYHKPDESYSEHTHAAS